MKDYAQSAAATTSARSSTSFQRACLTAFGVYLTTDASAETAAARATGFFAVGPYVDATPFDRKISAYDVAMDASGNFVVAANVPIGLTDKNRVIVRCFDAGGRLLEPEISVHQSSDGTPNGVAIAKDARGGFVVAWLSELEGIQQIQLRRFNSCSEPNTPGGFRLEPTDDGVRVENDLAVTMDADGDFLVA